MASLLVHILLVPKGKQSVPHKLAYLPTLHSSSLNPRMPKDGAGGQVRRAAQPGKQRRLHEGSKAKKGHQAYYVHGAQATNGTYHIRRKRIISDNKEMKRYNQWEEGDKGAVKAGKLVLCKMDTVLVKYSQQPVKGDNVRFEAAG